MVTFFTYFRGVLRAAVAGIALVAFAGLLRLLAPSAAPETTDQSPVAPDAVRSARLADALQIDAPRSAPVPSPAPGPRPEAERLGVAFVRPGRGTINFPDAPIEIHFTQPMDNGSVEAAFAVEPPVEGVVTWLAPSVFVFTPARPFALGAEISVRLGPGMREAGGARTLSPFSWSFPVVARYSFAANIGPWLRRTCRECHAPEGSARAIPLASHADVLPLVTPGHAAASRLIAALDDPTHRAALSAAVLGRRAILAEWIESFQAAP